LVALNNLEIDLSKLKTKLDVFSIYWFIIKRYLYKNYYI